MAESTPRPKPSGPFRIIRAFGWSLRGLRAAWTHERAFRSEVALTVILAPLAVWLGESAIERAMLLGSLCLVLVVELINSAIEAVVDLVSPEFHSLAGRAKDLGSAAVMLCLGNVLLVWGLLLL
jgi:diacylglycerol kinase (ATP)